MGIRLFIGQILSIIVRACRELLDFASLGFKNNSRVKIAILIKSLNEFKELLFSFFQFLFYYFKKRLQIIFIIFEQNKNILVRFFMMKRGRYNRPFLHITAMFVIFAGVLISPILADTFPILSSNSTLANFENNSLSSIDLEENVFQTNISQKPRDGIITYRAEKGDTLSTIAQKFDVSVETVKWYNDFKSDDLNIGDEIKILPVTGIAHKVAKGDTVYTIAKKYDTNPQKIVDFPFNDFANPETFSLVAGQILIVPDGVMPSEKPVIRKREIYVAQGPVNISSAGFTWPVQGLITQFSSWYHTALDIATSFGTPIVAAQNGKVVKALSGTWDSGYGTNIIIESESGYSSLYSHMSSLNVGIGDNVVAGKTVIGWIGLTGRTTGPHLHFEIRRNGALVNPLPYLQ